MINLDKIKTDLIKGILTSKPTGYIEGSNTLLTMAGEIVDIDNVLFEVRLVDWNGKTPVILLNDLEDEDAPTMEFDDIELEDMDWNIITDIYNLIE